MSDSPAGIFYAVRAGAPEQRANPTPGQRRAAGGAFDWARKRISEREGGYVVARDGNGEAYRCYPQGAPVAVALPAESARLQVIGLAAVQAAWARWQRGGRAR